jgi:Molybdopterin cofactor-binding domain
MPSAPGARSSVGLYVSYDLDADTGAVDIRRWIVAHDCGRVLQPAIVEGQIHGAVVQGIRDALNGQLAYDEAGQRLTATLMDYAPATAVDAPRAFEIRHLESPTPLNPLGAKGAGEGGIMPVHPLIGQAIEDALAPFGARFGRVPVTRADIHAMVRGAPQWCVARPSVPPGARFSHVTTSAGANPAPVSRSRMLSEALANRCACRPGCCSQSRASCRWCRRPPRSLLR